MADRTYVYGSGHDMEIFQWNASSGAQTGSFSGHSDMVSSMRLVAGILYSGSADQTIRLWDINAKQNTLVLSGKY